MKYIVAMIQPHKLTDVKQALFDEEVYAMTVSNALGCGNTMGYTETYRGIKQEVNLLKKVRLEIAVNDDFVERTIEAIITGAKTGEMGLLNKILEVVAKPHLRPNSCVANLFKMLTYYRVCCAFSSVCALLLSLI
jgi:nitrogen regulatory protein P-II 1